MDMSKYKSMFLAEAREHLSSMNQLVISLEKAPQDRSTIDSLFRAAHSIKGMAASMGYEDIAELSHKMEDMMDMFRKGEMTPTPEAADILLEGIDALERLVEAVEQDKTADVDVAAIIEKVKGFSTGGATAQSRELGVGSREQGVGEKPSPVSRPTASGFEISIEISKDSPAPAARAFLVLRKMREMGDILSIKPSEADIKSGRFSGVLSIGIKTDRGREEVETAIRGMGEIASTAFEPLEAQVQGLEGRGEPAHLPAGTKPETRELKPELKEHELPKAVKISTSLLDAFVNAIGEIIINKSRLHEISRGIPSRELKDGLNRMDRLIRNLQDRIMSVRMMPVGTVMERFPRVARDLARKQGKEVDLSIEGQEIELDRSILEGLGNPLTHIIRNCIDHGIELPDERRALGKPLPGVIRIKAFREKDQAVIEVSDDGRGMDPEGLKEAAVKKGLIAEEQAAELGGKEALFLICLPGFSTAKEVSDISGRGVGMDAVKSAVEALGGSIDIDSGPGEGTRVTLKLPLTVAIINSLLVEAASEVYAVPISKVMRMIEVRREDVKVSQKQRLIEFNGFLIPLLSLRKILRLQSGPVSEGFIPVVVAEIKGRTVGLVVDRFVGQQETFVKPLGSPLCKIPGLSGTTVLGNGKTVFLLDVGNLI